MTVGAIGKAAAVHGKSKAEDWLCNSFLFPLLEAAGRSSLCLVQKYLLEATKSSDFCHFVGYAVQECDSTNLTS